MVVLESPAKVNLGLWLLGKRSDGYHEILTLFHEIDLCDRIYIREGELRVETNTRIPQEKNLVFLGLKALERLTGERVEFSIFIEKRIPEGGGLGGGSSNLANTLKEVNRLLGNPLDMDSLKGLVSGLSSDAPFFLQGGTAIGRGRGELIEPVEHLNLTLTLILPSTKAITKEVYSAVREKHLTSKENVDIIISRLKAGDLSVLDNALGDLALEIYPEMAEAKRFLEDLGFKAFVSGSGSTLFYLGGLTPEVELGAKLRGWRVVEVKSRLGV